MSVAFDPKPQHLKLLEVTAGQTDVRNLINGLFVWVNAEIEVFTHILFGLRLPWSHHMVMFELCDRDGVCFHLPAPVPTTQLVLIVRRICLTLIVLEFNNRLNNGF